ncbi:AEC family transporter [Paenibacillus alkalitolerans]|uniref:AEC family transporter n=1 Tax=Paenibacillus alkalitolerans TaxID=2799335 RepID=UPI0018F449FA|nr:AEC family transporter [Paenibacillus alkalitolerans]
MSVFWLIAQNVMVPFFLLAGCGVLMQRKFRFDMQTLSKLNNYYLLPAVCFVKLYESEMNIGTAGAAIGFWLLLNAVLSVTAWVVVRNWRDGGGQAAVIRNGFILSNQGNYGLPVSEMVFAHQPLGMAIQVTISVVQNIYTYTFGIYHSISGGNGKAGDSGEGGKAGIWKMLQLPVVYALVAAMLFRLFDVHIPEVVWKPVEDVSDAFLAIALLTLGAQLSGLDMRKVSGRLFLGVFGRLVLSPVVALALIFLFGWKGIIAQALFIASSFPVSRNSALIALEYETSPDLAAQLVLFTTVISSLTVTLCIYAAQIIW